ncbi:MAG: TIGR03960 family B12-binding radical SAM protein [Clostridia bacterium]|nr:TIGR03960 family B12-binding radical SAM protein [Clostridia bacterium]
MTNEQKRAAVLRSVSKPGRYTGGEYGQIVKPDSEVRMRVAFCFPDTYEIGMSNLGMRILYHVLNQTEGVACERVYAPWLDMDSEMQKRGLCLLTHETARPVGECDIVAFTLQYELCYTTALHMMMLSNIPLYAKDRGEDAPILLGGGPCAYNAEPLADFFDIFSIGEGEEALPELCRLYMKMKREGTYSKSAFLHEAAKLKGFYVPSLYEISYHEDGTISAILPKYDDIPKKIKKRIVEDLDKAPFPEQFILPYIETVHDRSVIEVSRGCIRGCRFCQAGMVYRPIREKSPDTLSRQAKCLYDHSGHDEVSMITLSISDYSALGELTDKLLEWANPAHVGLSLPSLRIDSFGEQLMQKVSSVRASGITFAPEAGTQRLRDVINKNVSEEDLMRSAEIAFRAGKGSVKLYFMQGLPTETEEDLAGIADLANKVVDVYYSLPKSERNRSVNVTVSVSCFVPKPFTAFQWEGQDTLGEMEKKQEFLRSVIRNKHVRFHWHDARVSRLEAIFAKGDRRLSAVLALAVEEGVCFDAWDECFDFDAWMRRFEKVGIDPSFYANRQMSKDEILPWDMIECGVSREFLWREREKAYGEKTTPSCAEQCSGCGASECGGELRWCPKRK